MTDFYSQNRCVCSTRSHGPLLCAFCLSFHFKLTAIYNKKVKVKKKIKVGFKTVHLKSIGSHSDTLPTIPTALVGYA